MKILTYGPLKISLDLSPDQEKIFLETFGSDLADAKRRYEGRRS